MMLIVAMALAGTAWGGSYYGETNLAELQKRYSKGVARPMPWAGFWWPYTDNGIANDRYDRHRESPAEKVDLAFGYQDWARPWEEQNHGVGRGAPFWWGHCNGWATAAIMEREPRGPVTAGGVVFSVADRKAILTEYWMESGSDFIGTRVWDANDTYSAAFWDVVPAQFHLLMTNVVGRQGRSVIVDRYTGAEVWNQPVAAYEIEPIRPADDLGRHPEYSNIYRVNVTATLWWMNDEVPPNVVTKEFRWKEDLYYASRTLRYELWVDAPLEFDGRGRLVSSGDIVLTDNGAGGAWKNGNTYEALVNSHPDFIWIPLTNAGSSGYKNPRISDQWVQSRIVE